jgi:cell division protease FtsH
MVKIYGMDDEFGNVSFVDIELSERSKELIDKKVIELIQTITQQTQKIVQEHFSSIEKLAQTLLKKEVVYGDELSQIIETS